jgi:hypothetical protein
MPENERLWVFSKNGEVHVAWASPEGVALMSEQGYTCTQTASNFVSYIQIMDASETASGKPAACFAL